MLSNKAKQGIAGFTLIELMVVVVIIGILSAVGIPMYQNYVIRGYRTQAMEVLQEIILAQEQYYNNRVTYTTTMSDLNLGTLTTNSNLRYTFTLGGCSTPPVLTECVLATATPNLNTEQAEDGSLTINTRGQKRRIVGTGTSSSTYNWKGDSL